MAERLDACCKGLLGRTRRTGQAAKRSLAYASLQHRAGKRGLTSCLSLSIAFSSTGARYVTAHVSPKTLANERRQDILPTFLVATVFFFLYSFFYVLSSSLSLI